MKKGTKYLALTVLALALPALAACSPSGGEEGAALEKVKLGFGINVISADAAWNTTAPLLGEFWKEEGYDVEIVPVDGAATAFQLVEKGDLDATIGGSAAAYQLVGKGGSIKSVASFYETNTYYPVVLESSDIHSIEDFRGKNIGLNSLASAQGVWFDALLSSHGMSRDDMGEVIAVGTGLPVVNALENGEIDVYVYYHGGYDQLEQQTGISFRRFMDDPMFTSTPFGLSLWASLDTIDAKPELMTALIRGMAKGAVLSLENPEAVVAHHYDMYPQSRPSGDVAQAITDGAAALRSNAELARTSAYGKEFGLVSDAQVAMTGEVLLSGGLIEDLLSSDKYYTSAFISEANDYDLEALIAWAKALTATK